MSFENRRSTMEGGATSGGSDVQSQAAVSLCKAGCGFYANSAFEGMCSKCFRDDLLRKQQQQSAEELSTAVSADVESDLSATGSEPSADDSASQMDAATTSLDTATAAEVSLMSDSSVAISNEVEQQSVETGSPTIVTAKSIDTTQTLNTSSDVRSEEVKSLKEKPKKNRCLMCKKKVGLTGFGCRCGGLYCAVHRYSDKHDCSFNYKELGQEQIRKNNPVVVGEKIKKL